MTFAEKRAWLDRLAQNHQPGEEPNPALRADFDLVTRAGTNFYEGLTDEDLLAALRTSAARLGHSPAQREVFWVYRAYLKARFGKWPAALSRAGLSRSAGSGGIALAQMTSGYDQAQALLAQVRAAAQTLGRVPHPTDLPDVREGLQKRYATWGEVLSAAGIKRDQVVYAIPDLDADTLTLLRRLRAQAEGLNRAPLRSEVDEETRAALARRCGSWRNALYQIGLEPVVHIASFSAARLDQQAGVRKHGATLHDRYYRVLCLDADAQAALGQVAELAQTLGRPPKRGEVRPETRRLLQKTCGSWSNALFQLQPTPPVAHDQKNKP